ncbi:MAG: hypothetical protein V8S24_17230 [Gordonibacter pamelaeae]
MEGGRAEAAALPRATRARSSDADLARRFDEAVAACERDLRARCVHAVFRGRCRALRIADRVALAGCGLGGRDIARHLDGACEVANVHGLHALGAQEGERALRLRAGRERHGRAPVYEAAASALVEAAADAEEARIVAEAAARGLRTNFRYSPGFGDLPLAVQPAFLAALDAPRRIGLAATAGNLLVPTKSVTAVVGLFEGEPSNASARSTCASCALAGRCVQDQGRTCHGWNGDVPPPARAPSPTPLPQAPACRPARGAAHRRRAPRARAAGRAATSWSSAMGTLLQERGLTAHGELPDLLNFVDNPSTSRSMPAMCAPAPR